jgi:exodeoxyribonuclease-1
MDKTFFFYDLETSGLNQRYDRIMQFAGQRTDMELNPISEPVNVLVRLTDDALPSPSAIMVTKITPQQTLADGVSEAEFCRFVTEEVFVPNTIAVGYNTVRFDDEFMRATMWRNFYDPYEWEWKDGRSRWDMLDVVRLTRALRPEGINWPFTDEGKPTNRLELIT